MLYPKDDNIPGKEHIFQPGIFTSRQKAVSQLRKSITTQPYDGMWSMFAHDQHLPPVEMYWIAVPNIRYIHSQLSSRPAGLTLEPISAAITGYF